MFVTPVSWCHILGTLVLYLTRFLWHYWTGVTHGEYLCHSAHVSVTPGSWCHILKTLVLCLSQISFCDTTKPVSQILGVCVILYYVTPQSQSKKGVTKSKREQQGMYKFSIVTPVQCCHIKNVCPSLLLFSDTIST